MKALLTRKIGMTTTIAPDGKVSPVTLLSASANVITQVKTAETDGYSAVQLGFESQKKINKPLEGHLKKSGAKTRILKEVRTSTDDLTVGSEITAETFAVGDVVHVTGISKGKGFAGTIKRHNFKRGRKTHGNENYRGPGSIGSQYPQKVMKGKRMAGHMGNEQVTVRNLVVALVDLEHGVIGVIGAVPGPRKGIVLVKGAA
jgi:large subunit ribosomal protein L3